MVNVQCLLVNGQCLFGFLYPIFWSFLLALFHPRAIQLAAHDVVAHPGQIFHPSAADQNNGVFLQFVALAGNVGGHFHAVGQFHARHFAQRRVRLFGRGGEHLHANPPLERRIVIFRAVFQRVESKRQRRRFGLVRPLGPFVFDKLMNCCHK